ncbi:NADH-quinone oxidoreductase subunit L [Mucilaginibacter hurinus]|uniref:NADH-quinone oxidoreductase subunit L n=1 Tax=Mucilaginibacter hurinus TaxID=2201324 RepID=A0A367GUL0_9SPHI|nr:NADH-quinone oxidoreductase subunit L [Mucilaginibacter hurinus]
MLYTLIAVFAPLLAAIINFCLPANRKHAGWVSTGAVLTSAAMAAILFIHIWENKTFHVQQLWFGIGDTKVFAGIWLNNLSVMMLGLVSLIALPVHIYSIAYMHHDARFNRYFTYLSFFCFSMLALVVVDSLILFYAFWELVGFSSYLLIGFWFTREAAVQANKKAFIMNRIGDVGLLAAIIILFSHFHTFDMVALFGEDGLVANAAIFNHLWIAPNSNLPVAWHYVVYAGIFLAVAAKSAQFPLHSWLPDAMEGPTSVSALIHAATMVAAGVFLLGRVYPLFTAEELDAFAIIGCFTAFMAATIALTQNDLKRILAYSTISQLGFMVMAMGVGAYQSSLFHLVTHAFFKCLLFLAAGVVIHEMQHIKEENKLDINPQSILYMGGLSGKLPVTCIAAIIGAMALIGLPGTSGYLSKDSILIQAFEWSDSKGAYFKLVPITALITALLTAFYVTRLIAKVFFGDFKLSLVNPNLKFHISDGGWNYVLPLIALALCSLFPLFSSNWLQYEDSWLFEGLGKIGYADTESVYHSLIPGVLTASSLVVIATAFFLYIRSKASAHSGPLFRVSYNEWYVDKDYNKFVVQGVLLLSNALYWFDRNIIDGIINLFSSITKALAALSAWADRYIVDGVIYLLTVLVRRTGNFVRMFQVGRVQYYLYSMLAAVLILFILKSMI